MIKKHKILISILIFLLIILGLFFSFRKSASKEDSPPNILDPLGKTSVVVAKASLEINGEKYESEIVEGVSVYDFMRDLRQDGKINFKEINYTGIGKFIDEINGLRGRDGKFWIYYVNGEKAQIGVSNYKLKNGDIVSWKYEKDIN